MEFEDHEDDRSEEEEEEGEEETGLPPSYDPVPNSATLKMGSSGEMVLSHHRPRNSSNKARYRECLKNHAVGLGGHAVDGCGEFLAAGPEGTLDALKCAACSCHRNFHRKEDFSGGAPTFPPQFSPFYRTPSGYLQLTHQPPPPHHHRPLALPSTSGGGDDDASNPSGCGGGSSSRKRFRTKFTAEQKEKMLELAEKLGWRIQKHDEAVVQQFCDESGVKRQVLKVWMHNNKHTLGKKP